MSTPASVSDFIRQVQVLGEDVIDALNHGDTLRVNLAQQKFSDAIERA